MSHTKWCHICGLSVDMRKKGSINVFLNIEKKWNL
jgi:hypothetical protein